MWKYPTPFFFGTLARPQPAETPKTGIGCLTESLYAPASDRLGGRGDKETTTESSLASGGSDRVLPLVHRWPTFPTVAILELEGIESLLVVLGAVHLITPADRTGMAT